MKLNRILSTAVICFSLLSQLFARPQNPPSEKYLWPTDASKYLTSSFGEYRARRFHAGVDIRTWGKTGYKVFAIRPGYVWRIGVSPYGYGKVLYVKLDTGETAVFAHLLKFNSRIQKVVAAKQQRSGRYRVNMYLKRWQLPVEQGEVIAYTGQTGIGAPHLHFEIRDANSNPVNPLSKGYILPDNLSPVVRKISVSPLDLGSQVNGDFQPLIVEPTRLKAGSYIVEKPVTVWGDVGLGVSCFDKGVNSSGRYGVYSLKLYVDDVLRFQYAYDRMSFSKNPMVELERDYLLGRRNYGRFYKLYKDKHNTRTIYKPDKIWAGVLRCSPLSSQPRLSAKTGENKSGRKTNSVSGTLFPGEHEFRIEVADYFANTSTISGKIIVGAAYDIEPQIEKMDNGRIVVTDTRAYDLRDVEDLEAYYFTNAGWRPLVLETMSPESEKGGEGMPDDDGATGHPRFVARVAAQPHLLKFIGSDQFSARSYPYFFIESKSMSDTTAVQTAFDFAIDYYRDYARLKINTDFYLKNVPRLKLYTGKNDSLRIILHQIDLKTYIGEFPLKTLQGKFHLLKCTYIDINGRTNTVLHQFIATPVRPGTKATLISDDGRLQLKFRSTSLYDPFYGKIVVDKMNSAKNLKFAGLIYSVEPQDVLLNKGAYVKLHLSETEENPSQLGVYYQTKRGKWIFIDNQYNETDRAMSAKVLSFEKFALIRDDEPPSITNLYPRNSQKINSRRPVLSAHIRDKLSGIGSENDVELWLDGRKLISEYDPERNRVTYQVQNRLKPGPHELKVIVRDKVKNSASERSVFTVN